MLEMGVGTGTNLQYYNGVRINKFTGVEWSDNMLLQAFSKLALFKGTDKLKMTDSQCKLVRGDCHALNF